MSMTNCHICNISVTETPLYRDGPTVERVPWICESCKVNRGDEITRCEITDIIDMENNTIN